MRMYQGKSKKYFSNPRYDLISLIPGREGNRVLEVGAGSCDTLCEIKRSGLAMEVTGIELVSLPGTMQHDPLIDRLIIGDIEKMDPGLSEKYFDVIICGDVLEHLTDPWSMMKKIANYLKDDGVIIISVPNIREYHIMYRIFFLGDFRYTDQGILDKTHLRFFCKKNIIEMLSATGFEPVSVNPIFRFDRAQRKNRILDMFTFGIIRDFLTAQYVIVSHKKKL